MLFLSHHHPPSLPLLLRVIVFQSGYPDGATVDSEGCVWVAMFSSGEARRFSPEGELLRTIAVSLPTIGVFVSGGFSGVLSVHESLVAKLLCC